MSLRIAAVQSEELRFLLGQIDLIEDGVIEDYEVNNIVPDGYINLEIIPKAWSYNQFHRVQNLLHEHALIGRTYDLPKLLSLNDSFIPTITREVVEVEGDDFCGSVIWVKNWHEIKTREHPEVGKSLSVMYQVFIHQLLEAARPTHILGENLQEDIHPYTQSRIEAARNYREEFPDDIISPDGFTMSQMLTYLEVGFRVYVWRHPDVFVHRTIAPEEFREIYGANDMNAAARLVSQQMKDDYEKIFYRRGKIATREIGRVLRNWSEEPWLIYGAEHMFAGDIETLPCRPALISIEFPIRELIPDIISKLKTSTNNTLGPIL